MQFDYNIFLEELIRTDIDQVCPFHRFSLTSNLDKIFLHTLSKSLKQNSLILEIGTYIGGATSILAFANSKVKIISIDTYEDGIYHPSEKELLDIAFGKGERRTYENVKNKLNVFSNVKVLKGGSPEDFHDLNIAPDVYIEDGVHEDPRFSKSIDYWFSKLKLNGYIIIHDFRPTSNYEDKRSRKPDVERKVLELINEKKVKPLFFHGAFVMLQKI